MDHDTAAPKQAAPPGGALMQMIRGYFAAQLAGVTARLGIADELAAAPRSSAELAAATGANPDSLARFLRASEVVGLLRQAEPGRYALTPVTDPLVSRDGSPNKSAFISTFAATYTSAAQWMPWGRLFETVVTGRAATKEALGMGLWDYYAAHPDEGAGFAELMGILSADAAQTLVTSYDFTPFTRVVDVGGSHGTLLCAVLAAAPHTTGVLFDLPEVVERAAASPAVAALGGRVELAGGDFLGGVPAGGDLYLLKQVLCDWDDQHAGRILASCHQAAPAGSTLLLIDWLMPDDECQPSPLAIMDLGLLVASDGRVRTQREYQRLLADAGYEFRRLAQASGQFPSMWCLIEAVRR